MSANIYVVLQPTKYPTGEDVAVSMNLEECIIRDAFIPLDFPDSNAPLFARMCCTDSATIAKTVIARDLAIEIITKAVTKALVDILYSKDTKMGYAKHQELAA